MKNAYVVNFDWRDVEGCLYHHSMRVEAASVAAAERMVRKEYDFVPAKDWQTISVALDPNLEGEAWESQFRDVRMENKLWNSLDVYLLMTTKYRDGEIDACRSLAAELGEDGAPKFPRMAEMASFWEGLSCDIDRVQRIVSRA